MTDERDKPEDDDIDLWGDDEYYACEECDGTGLDPDGLLGFEKCSHCYGSGESTH